MRPRPGTEMVHEIRVAWGDCDPAKIVYTARIPWFALDAINAWWVKHLDGDGWYQMELDRNVGTPFVRMEIDFKHPVTPREVLKCHVWPSRLGRTSVEFRVDGLQGGKTCFAGRFVSVFTVTNEFRKRPPPEEMRAALQRHIPA
ncbi:MAG: acyl-CoA thioesterase [Paracoccaceae bacterium]|nr:acyl-CoA thioesterase [Paracoccaceae bacterium]